MSDQNNLLRNLSETNNANSERELLGAFIMGILAGSEHLDKFSSWLLAGTAATAAVYVTSVDKLLPFLTSQGFKVAGLALVISGVFGVLAKVRALLVSIVISQRAELMSAMGAIFERHDKIEEEILGLAKQRGEKISANINFQKVFSELAEVLPWPFKGRFQRGVKVGESDPNHALKVALRSTLYQGVFISLQVISVLGFLILVLYYTSAI